MMRTVAGLTIFIVFLSTSAARADDPKFEYGKVEEVKKVEWKASAQFGMIITTGNSRARTLNGGAIASRKDKDNKFVLEAGGAYVRSNIYIAQDLNGNGTIDNDGEITDTDVTSSKAWSVKGRYDRFFTEKNSLYITGIISADEPAGKELVGGGQIGYSRLVIKNKLSELVAEGGYDFTYEDTVVGDAVTIHSARLFGGYTATISGNTTAAASLEALFNLNEEDGPTGSVSAFEDTRLLGKAALTTKLGGAFNLRVGFTLHYDHAPAPLPPFPGIMYGAGFIPLAKSLDTTTEVALIINLI